MRAGVSNRVLVYVILIGTTSCLLTGRPAAQTSGISTRACQLEVINEIRKRSQSGIDIILRDGPIPAQPSSIAPEELRGRCISYILNNDWKYHPACPCPLP
jgi:hypothetical protein